MLASGGGVRETNIFLLHPVTFCKGFPTQVGKVLQFFPSPHVRFTGCLGSLHPAVVPYTV